MDEQNTAIEVTKTFLPDINEYISVLNNAWKTSCITNRGALVLELENLLKRYFGVPHLTLTANGTLPIQIAIKAMSLQGEIITTPFSYVATCSSIVWEGCKPVFVDIDPVNLTIDTKKIESQITKRTSAIIATHVYGNPCDVYAIESVAKRNKLTVIYDSAHCFGVKYLGKSIFQYGDISTCSFHATKIFHTGEGGCWITKNADIQKKLFYHHNFGHKGTEYYYGIGINAKMSELQAALGISIFNHIPEILNKRKLVYEQYRKELVGKSLSLFKVRDGTHWNYSYVPVIFDSEESLLKAIKRLNNMNIFPRRYFFPSLNMLPYTSGNCPISEDFSRRVVCLPSSTELQENSIIRICEQLD